MAADCSVIGPGLPVQVRSRAPTEACGLIALIVAIPQTRCSGSLAQAPASGSYDVQYCGSKVSFTIFEKLFVETSFMFAV
jgi:hypothetical protein